MSDLERLRGDFPFIRWTEPVHVSTPDAVGLACRICIAVRGLRGDEVEDRLFDDREQFAEHMKGHS